MWWGPLVGLATALVVLWIGLLVVLWRTRPDAAVLREAVRLLPDVVRLLGRLARDRSLGRGLRLRLTLLLLYLALPVDLVPDFLPGVGYADDAVLVVWTLRSVARSAGSGALARHWPGTPAGLATVCGLAGLDRR